MSPEQVDTAKSNYYEYMIITRQNFLQDNKPDELLKKVSSMLGANGEIIRHEYWGLCNFQYVIKRKRRGHYVLLYLKTTAEVVNEIQKKMSIDDNILRYLVNKIARVPSYISPLAQDLAANEDEAVSSDALSDLDMVADEDADAGEDDNNADE